MEQGSFSSEVFLFSHFSLSYMGFFIRGFLRRWRFYLCMYLCMYVCVLDLKRCMTDLFSLFYLHKTSNDVNTMIMKLLVCWLFSLDQVSSTAGVI